MMSTVMVEVLASQHTHRTEMETARATATRFELSQSFYFEAAHTLQRTVDFEASCRIHGHTYDAEVTVSGIPDQTSGMVVDLAYLRTEIARVRDLLDHRLLDEVQGIGPPTLENLCMFIRSHLEDAVPGLCGVTVERKASGDRCHCRW